MKPPLRLTPAVALAAPALAAVAIALVFTLKRSSAAPAPSPKRFSGSTVVLRMPSLLASARLPVPLAVDVVRDGAAADFYNSPATLDSIVAAWRTVLASTGADVRIVSPAQLRSGRRARVIVVPSSPCLTVATREAMELAGSRGQGLIVTGSVGTYDAGCRALGYGTLISLTGASRAEVLRDAPMVYVTIPADGPLSADIPPGARLSVAPAGQIALRVPARDAFYSNYTLEAAPAGREPYLDAAVVRAEYRGARVVYFGFELRDAERSPWDMAVLRLLVRNATAWTANVPFAAKASWPDGRASAAVISQDVENRFVEARYALDSLRAAGVRSSFFVLSDLASKNKRLLRKMLESGEVGTHSENHQLYGGLPLARQIERLWLTRRSLEKLIQQDVPGLRPPEEQFDQATMTAWVGAGGRYLLGANDSRCAAPELLPVGREGRDTLLLVPRVFADDFSATGRARRRPSVARSVFDTDIQTAKRVGGLYVLSYHSQLLSRPEYVPVLASLARDLAADSSVWMATAGEVSDWWMARARLATQVRAVGANALDVVVRNRATAPVRDLVLLVSLPAHTRVTWASSPIDVRPDGVARVRLASVPARATRVVNIRLLSDSPRGQRAR